MVFKLLTLLIFWAMWNLVVGAWRQRHVGGIAVTVSCEARIIHIIRHLSRRDPLVDHKDFYPYAVNFLEKGAAHGFRPCLL